MELRIHTSALLAIRLSRSGASPAPPWASRWPARSLICQAPSAESLGRAGSLSSATLISRATSGPPWGTWRDLDPLAMRADRSRPTIWAAVASLAPTWVPDAVVPVAVMPADVMPLSLPATCAGTGREGGKLGSAALAPELALLNALAWLVAVAWLGWPIRASRTSRSAGVGPGLSRVWAQNPVPTATVAMGAVNNRGWGLRR